MFDEGQSESREKRVIVTGNLLAGFSTIRGGQIIHFTAHDGETRQGILMPRRFKLEEFVESAPVSMPPERAAQFFSTAPSAQLKSSDGAVTVQRWGNEYAMLVSKSKAEGGRYYLDPELRDLVGDFVSVGSSMRAMLNKEQLGPAMKVIADKFEQKFETVAYRKEALAAGGSAIGSQKAQGDESFARGVGGGKGLAPKEIESAVREILSHFAVQPSDVTVYPTIKAARAAFGEHIPDDAQAFHNPENGSLHFIAENIHDASEIPGLMVHEYVTHFGLRAMFGDYDRFEYQQILDNIVRGFPIELYRRGRQQFGKGFTAADRRQRNKAAEEVLAYYAQKQAAGQGLGSRIRRVLDRFLGMIRDFGRRMLGLEPKYDELWLRNVISGLHSGSTSRRGIRPLSERSSNRSGRRGPARNGKRRFATPRA